MKKITEVIQKNLAWFLLIIVCLIFGVLSKDFFSLVNIFNILNQNAYIIITACGYVLIMIAGEIDLAAGYHMSICGVLCALLLTQTDIPIFIVIIVIILISMCFAILTTFLCKLLGISRFFVTLALNTIYQGAGYVITGSKTITGMPDAFKKLGQGTIFHPNLTYATLLMLLFCIIISFVLNRTYFGRYVFALGGGESVARLSGIDVDKVKYSIGAIYGFFAGIGACILVARVGAAAANTASGTEFTVITGALLGGVSIRGGEGKLSNCVAGILLIGLLGNGMQLIGWNPYYQYVVKGTIMLAVVAFDTYQIKQRNKKEMASKENDTPKEKE